MKRSRLRQSLVYLLIGLVVFAFINVSWADGVEVEVPYAVTTAQWWTGMAIKNLDASSATDTIRIEFFDKEGVFMGAVEIAPLEPLEIYSQTVSTIYPGSLPLNYSIRISQPGNEELAVTVFVGNSETGGFAYQTYSSQTCSQATVSALSWHQILPTAERFELVMSNEAVLDRETGMVWERDTDATKYDWFMAQEHCYKATIGGRGGWRLPTIEELKTLDDPTQSNPALPNGHPFTRVQLSSYWSSTTQADFADGAWLFSFASGNAGYYYKSYSYYVRAVRSGQ